MVLMNRNPLTAPAKTVVLVCAVIMGAALVSGCATTAAAAKDPVPERAQARWDALLAGDFATAYGYYTPGYRSSNSVSDFELQMRLKQVRWKTARYREHSCDENTCDVKIDLGYKVATPVPGLKEWKGKSTIDERWIKTQGQWWYVQN